MYKRASSSYTAFKSGLDDVFHSGNKSDELDELEVLGGRKSVITPKSNTNSPSYIHEGNGGSSPRSHSGTAEILMVLHRHSPARKSNDFEMGQNSSQFQQAPYPKLTNDAECAPLATGVGYMDAHTSTAPETHLGLTSSNQTNLPTEKGGNWHTPYTNDSHHHYPQQSSPSGGYMSYRDAVPLREPDPDQSSFGYLPPPLTQDEIWRNFMLGFSGQ